MIIYFPPPRRAVPATFPAARHPSRTHMGLVPNIKNWVCWISLHHFLLQKVGARAWVHKNGFSNWFVPNTICMFSWPCKKCLRWQIIFPAFMNRWHCRLLQAVPSLKGMPGSCPIQILLGHLVKAHVFVTTSIICQEVLQIIRMGTNIFNHKTCVIKLHQSCSSIVWVLQDVD